MQVPARPRDQAHRGGVHAQGGQVIAERSGLDAGRVGGERVSGVPRKPVTGSDAHARATDRLVGAAADLEWLSQRNDAACGTRGEHAAMAALAAANERFAAREAWVKYIEHGY